MTLIFLNINRNQKFDGGVYSYEISNLFVKRCQRSKIDKFVDCIFSYVVTLKSDIF